MKYGIRFTTIRYWQRMAADLWLYNGIRFVGCLRARNFNELGAQQIGHDAIAAAFKRTPAEMRNLLLVGHVLENSTR